MKINPIHVEDAMLSIVSLLEKNNSSIYNLAGPEILSLRQISEGLGNYLKEKPVFNNVNSSSANIIADISLMKSELHTPSISLLDRFDDLK